MAESSETIITRFMRLNQLILGKSNYKIPRKYLLHRDALLDVLFALYEECNVDYLRKNKNINAFVDKFKILMPELKTLRVNLKDFEIKKVIGRGHFGTVNVVREKATGDVYAMKVLCKNETLSQQNVAFFEEERDIMIKSASPWITKLQYAFQDTLNLYLVMEFHPGGDMLSLLQRNDYVLSEDMSKFYLAELILAIHSVHSMGYVHRDIKPDNILIDRTGHIKLADFGSSSKLNINQQVTSNMPVGTPDYVAPEVLTAMNALPGSSKGYGVECDWWSLGIVAYEMVFGSTPFASDKVLFTYNNIMNFKNFFKFPPEAAEVSNLLIDLIKNLLQDSDIRYGYDKLTTHEFFLDIDWNNIRNVAPPFLPTLSSVDDTSNFDDFEPENRPTLSELKVKREFTGKNLPFVGFTYAPSFETAAEKSLLAEDNQCQSIDNQSAITETDSASKTRAMIELQKELSLFSERESSLRSEIIKLRDNLQTKDREIENLKEEKLMSEELVIELQAEVKQVKELIAYEHDHRVLTEKKATHLIKCMKQKRKQDAILLKAKSHEYNNGENEKQYLEDQLEEANFKINELVKEKTDILTELYDTKHILLECQQKLSEKEQELLAAELNLSRSNSTLNESLKKKCSPNVERKLIKKLEKRNVALEKELETMIDLKHKAESQIISLHKIISELKRGGKVQISENSCTSEFPQQEGLIPHDKEQDIPEKQEKEVHEKSFSIEEITEEFAKEKEIISDLQLKLNNSEAELQKQIDIVKNLEEKVKSLDEISEMQKQKSESELQKQIAIVKSLEAKLKCIEEIPELQNKNDISKNNENEEYQDKSCPWVRKSLSRNERQERLLFSDMKHENKCLKTKIESLTSEISDLKNNLKNKENGFEELQRQLAEKNNALSDAKLELRVSTRKEHLADTLRERNKDLREQLKAKEEEVYEKSKMVEDFQNNVNSLEREINDLKQEILNKEKFCEIEKAKYEERLRTLKDTCEDTKDVNQKYAKTQGQYEEIMKQNSNLTKECEDKTKKNVQLMEEIKTLKNELSKKQSECNKYMKINTTVKNACIDMEDELKNFETLVEARDLTIAKVVNERDKLSSELVKCKAEMKNLQSSFKKTEQHRDNLMKHVQELTSEIENQNSLHEAELQMVQDQLEHYKKCVAELEKKTNDLQNCVSSRNKDTASYSKKILDLESQLCVIKEEAANHITQISSLKASNSKLTQALDDSLKKQQETEKTINELYNEKDSEKAKYDHERVKLQETISQQTKLIDFLQNKTENMEKKKKPITRLFGKKDAPSQPFQSRDLEKLLETERSRCRRLQDQLSQARAEKMELQRGINNLTEALSANVEAPATPKSRAMHTAIAYSPTSKSNLNGPLDSNEPADQIIKPPGMKHKIPHRFSEVMCMRNTKCCICLDSVYLGRTIVKCQECLLECHPKCASSLPKTCRLPSGFMQHFKTAVQNSTSCSESQNVPNISEGWIKIPKSNKHGWDRRYMCLKDDILYIFEKDDDKDPENALMVFEFMSNEATVTVTSAVSASELPYVANSDLPFVLKIESFPPTTCWPMRCLYLMTSNFNEKQMWVSILEKLAEKNENETNSSQKKLEGKLVWTLKGNNIIDALCTSIFDKDTILLGATEGLFLLSVNNDGPFSLIKKVDEISCIYQINILKKIGVIVFIIGEDRKLCWIQTSALSSKISESSSLTFNSVAEVENCHLFAVEENENISDPYICCATSQIILLCQYDVASKLFHKRKIINVNEPCSCIHFTQNFVIFGADIFYELDLNDHSVKVFLDGSDASLAGLVYGAPQFRSFPVAILKISDDKQVDEYLLCFHEMGVFVNGQGRRTRSDDLKWARLPLSFAFRIPYLFVIHFNSIEVMEIPSQVSLNVKNRRCMPVQNPQLLGWAHIPTAILISSRQDDTTNLILVDGSCIGNSNVHIQMNGDTNSTSNSPKNNCIRSIPESEELDFSFTSSIEQGFEPFDDQTRLSEDSVDN